MPRTRSRNAPVAACAVAALTLHAFVSAHAAPLTATLKTPAPPDSGYFKMGANRSPAGHVLTIDNRSLRLDNEPWLPAMGEFHYIRYPADEWREELLKMKAAGIDIVATYVFWIHHEEIEGTWDWTEQRDLRRFVETAHDVGLRVVVRCGPWCHGEVRNGGLPEWVVAHKDWKLRSTDPAFLAATRALYRQIAIQLHGLLWKDGGPVIGIQVDNEYRGPAAYLLALKSLALEEGLDVPLYTRTGWPALTTPMPVGEIVPLYGVYAEGFWDRELTSMPGRYWAGFQFSALRSDAAIATEMLGQRAAKDDEDVEKYPYLTCEIGGGMMNSYHRRILVDPRDIEATTLIKIAAGSTLPGYYMFHGGTNPEGRRTTLMEAQDTAMTNYNDLPVKTYDFQAPLGEFGEVRPHYHRLRRLHSFLHDYGAELSGMTISLPEARPTGRNDVTTLRWAARSDGRHGFVFISNYERSKTLPPKSGVQFTLTLENRSTLTFPTEPITIPGDAICWWPFNVNVGGVTLVAATAQPFSHVVEANGTRTVFFAATDSVPVEFIFDRDQIEKIETSGRVVREPSRLVVRDVPTGRSAAIRLMNKSGNVLQCVVLDAADSLAFWKGPVAGRERAIVTQANLVFDAGGVRVEPNEPGEATVAIFPAPRELRRDAKPLPSTDDGVFRRYVLPATYAVRGLDFESVRASGPLREIKQGPIKQGVAMQPSDADFAAAAVWRVQLPKPLDPARHPRLRFTYAGDVARVRLGERFLTDDFYNGLPRDVGLWRYGTAVNRDELRFEVLPLQKDAPIFLAESARPDFGDAPGVAVLRKVELIETGAIVLTALPGDEPKLPANFKTETGFSPRTNLAP